MSSRDFTHELHRTTKTLGYSKVIETLQSMAKIQPTGANDIPTTFRQHRSERAAHDTFGEISTKFFNILQADTHINIPQKTYLRNPNNAFSPDLMGFRNTLALHRQPVFSQHGMYIPLNTSGSLYIETTSSATNPDFVSSTRINEVVYTALHYISTNNSERDHHDRSLFLTMHGYISQDNHDDRLNLYMRGRPLSTRVEFPIELGDLHMLLGVRWDEDGTPESSIHVNGVKYTVNGPLGSNVATNVRPEVILQNTFGGHISHVTQFTRQSDSDFDLADWIAKDRAGLRDLGHTDMREWFTWRASSLSLEHQEFVGAYS